jgi:RHS repeat-associated protein
LARPARGAPIGGPAHLGRKVASPSQPVLDASTAPCGRDRAACSSGCSAAARPWSGPDLGGPDHPSHSRFTGHARDGSRELVNMGARTASSSLARFTAADPIPSAFPFLPQTWNRYAYVTNEPTVATDPHGEVIIATTIQVCVNTHPGGRVPAAGPGRAVRLVGPGPAGGEPRVGCGWRGGRHRLHGVSEPGRGVGPRGGVVFRREPQCPRMGDPPGRAGRCRRR